MAKSIQLSVLLVFKNQKEEIEPTLTALYELESVNTEIVIIDDGSTDGGREVIYSLLDHYQHENTFFFEHDRTIGRGNCLNEGLQQVSGKYLWAPRSIDSIDEDHLEQVLEAFGASEKTGLIQSPERLPVSVEEWVEYLANEPLPPDAIYLWNMERIPPRERFFDPYLINHHGTEMAVRVLNKRNAGLVDPYFVVHEVEHPIKPDLNVLSEFVFTLLRRPAITSEQRDFLISLLNPALSEQVKVDPDATDDELLRKAVAYYRAGNISAALELANVLLEHDEHHIEARKLKIEVLEKLRRYVEAAELKHMLKKDVRQNHEEQKEPVETEEESEAAVEEKIEEPVDEEADTDEEASEEIDTDEEEPEEETDKGPEVWSSRPVRSEEPQEEEPGEETDEQTVFDEEPTDEPEDEPIRLDEDGIAVSVIIPTVADGKAVLERCMVSLEKNCDPDITELIVIDNASLDDTHDYLQQLEDDGFFGCKVITNHENHGFGPSINQGLDKAEGRYACILHNDAMMKKGLLEQMVQLMDKHPEYAVIGPRTNRSLNPDQQVDNSVGGHAEVLEAEYLDSFCMMVRMETGLRMDEQFVPAFFEDLDLCFQAKSEGYKVGMVPNLSLDHYYAYSTEGMGLDLDSPVYWKNVRLFNDKWKLQHSLPENVDEMPLLDKLHALAQIVNPVYPQEYLHREFDEWMTDEAKTKLLKRSYQRKELLPLVDIMLIMDQRDVLRRLEDQLDQYELPDSLVYRLVSYYYEKNIYSRCKHYLGQLSDEQRTPRFQLLELQIAVSEKELDKAIPLLNDLMEQAPGHPLVYKLTGDIHRFQGNDKEAQSFYELAAQLDPFRFGK